MLLCDNCHRAGYTETISVEVSNCEAGKRRGTMCTRCRCDLDRHVREWRKTNDAKTDGTRICEPCREASE